MFVLLWMMSADVAPLSSMKPTICSQGLKLILQREVEEVRSFGHELSKTSVQRWLVGSTTGYLQGFMMSSKGRGSMFWDFILLCNVRILTAHSSQFDAERGSHVAKRQQENIHPGVAQSVLKLRGRSLLAEIFIPRVTGVVEEVINREMLSSISIPWSHVKVGGCIRAQGKKNRGSYWIQSRSWISESSSHSEPNTMNKYTRSGQPNAMSGGHRPGHREHRGRSSPWGNRVPPKWGLLDSGAQKEKARHQEDQDDFRD